MKSSRSRQRINRIRLKSTKLDENPVKPSRATNGSNNSNNNDDNNNKEETAADWPPSEAAWCRRMDRRPRPPPIGAPDADQWGAGRRQGGRDGRPVGRRRVGAAAASPWQRLVSRRRNAVISQWRAAIDPIARALHCHFKRIRIAESFPPSSMTCTKTRFFRLRLHFGFTRLDGNGLEIVFCSIYIIVHLKCGEYQ